MPNPGGYGIGSVPPEITFTAGAGKKITITASGSWSCGLGSAGPAGGSCGAYPNVNILPFGGIGGFQGRQMSLIGIFLADANPPNVVAGNGIGQPLFMGAGGTFDIPATATRLVLGMGDECTGGGGGDTASCYGDNGGTISVNYSIEGCRITSISWDTTDNKGRTLDRNPNAGGGHRIFAEHRSANDSGPTTIQVRIAATPNTTLYLLSFDVADPDPDFGNPRGSDNNGSPKLGALAPLTVQTDAAGAAIATFTPSTQPGDNFRVVAACSASDRASITVTGTDLTGLPLSNGAAARTDLLTVWRHLNIEVDSMGPVAGNSVSGSIISAVVTGRSTLLRINTPAPLATNQYENGRIFISGYGDFPVDRNTVNTITVTAPLMPVGTPPMMNVLVGRTFTLVDDDDVNDRGIKDGDNGQTVPLPDLSWLDPRCDDERSNKFKPAYICPTFLPTPPTPAPFVQYLPGKTIPEIRSLFTNSRYIQHNRDDFWTVYLLGAYQGRPDESNDPDRGRPFNSYGISDGTTPSGIGQGSLVFMELLSNHELDSLSIRIGTPPTFIIDIREAKKLVPVHELGHLLGGDHRDNGIMAEGLDGLANPVFSPQTVARMRRAKRP
jgi:hypothetical protein